MSDRELLETLVRWSESAGSSLTALELDIARLRGDLKAMEARLMRRIETVLPSPHLRSEHDATQQRLEQRLDKLEKPPEASLRDRFDAVEDRLGLIEKRIATVEARLDDVVHRQSSLEGRMDRMVSLLERIAKAQGISET